MMTSTKKQTKGEAILSGKRGTKRDIAHTEKGYQSVRDPKTGKVTYTHILVAEKRIGRKLKPDETVDHKNGDKNDNRPSNLKVVSRAENVRLRHQRDKAKKNGKKA
ncbi:HNH endonuclease signature motif containing protein [Streptomyces sp. NPDC020379]|uniref:HNH endonuclease signature motif containing protein n=1 Tax=Streptomyces sp. NPDC020379 TaxID=3365071 RepID=UPI003795D4AF